MWNRLLSEVKITSKYFGILWECRCKSKEKDIMLKGGERMAFYFQLYWHLLLMIMVMIILAGLITFLIPRIPSVLVLAFSGLIGLIYARLIEMEQAYLFFISINLLTTILPILLIRYLQYLKRTAEEMEKRN